MHDGHERRLLRAKTEWRLYRIHVVVSSLTMWYKSVKEADGLKRLNCESSPVLQRSRLRLTYFRICLLLYFDVVFCFSMLSSVFDVSCSQILLNTCFVTHLRGIYLWVSPPREIRHTTEFSAICLYIWSPPQRHKGSLSFDTKSGTLQFSTPLVPVNV